MYTFIDLFAGIGGFHQALHSVGMKCVFASECDKNARISYEANYKNISPDLFVNNYRFFNEDITIADPQDIPDFDICCGGFPCQPFSIAGLRKGSEDTRGTLFFNIANIIKHKIETGNPPRILFLENVKGLKNHDKGQTLQVILATLEELGYSYSYEVVNAKYFGVPQNRERLFIIAWYKQIINAKSFCFPLGIDKSGASIFDKKKLVKNCIETHVGDVLSLIVLVTQNTQLVIECGLDIKTERREIVLQEKALDIVYSKQTAYIVVQFLPAIGKMAARFLSTKATKA